MRRPNFRSPLVDLSDITTSSLEAPRWCLYRSNGDIIPLHDPKKRFKPVKAKLGIRPNKIFFWGVAIVSVLCVSDNTHHNTYPQKQAGVSYPREITAPLPEVDPLVPPEGSEDE